MIIVKWKGNEKEFEDLCDAKEHIEDFVGRAIGRFFQKNGNNDDFCLVIQEDDDAFEEDGEFSFDWHSECEFTDEQHALLDKSKLPDSMDDIISKLGIELELVEPEGPEIEIKLMTKSVNPNGFFDRDIPVPDCIYDYFNKIDWANMQAFFQSTYGRNVRSEWIEDKGRVFEAIEDPVNYSMFVNNELMVFAYQFFNIEISEPKTKHSPVVYFKAKDGESVELQKSGIIGTITESIAKYKNFGAKQIRFESVLGKEKFKRDFPKIVSDLQKYYFAVEDNKEEYEYQKPKMIYIVSEYDRDDRTVGCWNCSFNSEEEAMEAVVEHCEDLGWEIEYKSNDTLKANNSKYNIGYVYI